MGLVIFLLAVFILLVLPADKKLRRYLVEPVSPGMRVLVWLLCLPLPLLLFLIADCMPTIKGQLSWGVLPASVALFSALSGSSLASKLSKTRGVYLFAAIIGMLLFICMLLLMLAYEWLVAP